MGFFFEHQGLKQIGCISVAAYATVPFEGANASANLNVY